MLYSETELEVLDGYEFFIRDEQNAQMTGRSTQLLYRYLLTI